ncbi:MAG: HAMP domain-containing histidine kinase [Alicyclobacillus sp.]|nr:HAMP domain-containing histidine kinase [Alicyclobacillus sp.]
MFQRVRIRITALTLAIVICLYAISSLAVYSIVREAVLRSVDQRLNTVVQTMPSGNINRVLATLPPGTWMVVHTPVADLSNSAPSSVLNTLETWASSGRLPARARATLIPQQGMELRALYLPLGPNSDVSGYIVVAIDILRELAVLERLRDVLFAVGCAGLLAAAFAGFYLAERALRPIRAAWRRQLQFVADASHELRTPLAVIQSNLGIVLEHTHESVTDNLEWIHNAHSEARRLSKLVQDLLTLARGDAEQVPLSLQTVDVSELAGRMAELFEPVAHMRELTLTRDCDPHVLVKGDPDRLHQLLVILVDNACKFTPAGGTVTLRVHKQRHTATLEVSDTGIGIEDKHLPRIFDRFYQADAARARGPAQGTGLGLAIAKWIVEAHRGKISVTSRVGQGTTFTVQLPLA